MSDLLHAVLSFLASNYGGTLLSFVFIAYLFYRGRECERQNRKDRQRVETLTGAVIQLHGAVKLVSGRRKLEIPELDQLLKEKP